MHKFLLWAPVLGAVACNNAEETMAIQYPETRKDTTVFDEYHGTRIADPYRWLEDDRSAETEAWVKAQNEVTDSFLSAIPYRQAIVDRMTKLWNYEKISAPFTEGKYTYFYKNDGLQNQSVLFRKEGDGEAKVFLDPNTFSKEGTTSLAGLSFTKDGSLAAYQISEGGSDWRKVIIINTETGQQVEDTLRDVKFSGLAWRGNEGFYYSSYDKPKEGSELSGLTAVHKLYFHKLGTPQSQDELIFGGPNNPKRYISAGVSEDERFLIISAANSTTGNELYLKDLSKSGSAIETIVGNMDQEYDVVHTEGNDIFLITNLNAPNRRLTKMTWGQPDPTTWVDVIPETDMPLSMSTGGGYFFASYLKDATSLVKQFKIDGSLVREIALPAVGSANGFGSKWEEKTLYYSFTNYAYPSTTFSYDVETGESKEYQRSAVQFDPSKYTSEQVFFTSKDGTKVPMIITYRSDLKKDGKNPTMLYGYGGFNISLTPAFSTARIIWLENGGIFAVANLRGGGEYGEQWHTAGTQMQKQNVFDDFIAAGEYLIAQGYTSSPYLAINGGSNGGLLVGATMLQRPDLMRVAIPEVGVLDMLRYNKFTAGAGWAYDYGTAEQSPEMFKYLLGYSPVHNTKPGACYPATMVMTADHDDRVVPAHSFKFAAALQAAQGCNNPALIRIETNAGHGAGKPTDKIIREEADIWAFCWWNMGFKTLKLQP
jgi:prolyl oligopeptidase